MAKIISTSDYPDLSAEEYYQKLLEAYDEAFPKNEE